MTELGRRDSSAGGPEQFAVAEMLVRGFRSSPDLKAFQERWYAFMASVFTDELNAPRRPRAARARDARRW